MLCMILEKTVEKNKKDLLDKLHEALWAYRTIINPYPSYAIFIFGGEIVLPLRSAFRSIRIVVYESTTNETNPGFGWRSLKC